MHNRRRRTDATPKLEYLAKLYCPTTDSVSLKEISPSGAMVHYWETNLLVDAFRTTFGMLPAVELEREPTRHV